MKSLTHDCCITWPIISGHNVNSNVYYIIRNFQNSRKTHTWYYVECKKWYICKFIFIPMRQGNTSLSQSFDSEQIKSIKYQPTFFVTKRPPFVRFKFIFVAFDCDLCAVFLFENHVMKGLVA